MRATRIRGYHVELVASPPRKITWAELSDAARAPGWQVSDADQVICLMRDGRFLNHADDGPWVKSPDDEVLSARIDLAHRMGLRARGDEWESDRSLTDCYSHPDDAKEHAKAMAPNPGQQRRAQRQGAWDLFRIVVLIPLFAPEVHVDTR